MFQKGFSMMELIVVLALISVLVAMSAMAFSSYNRKYRIDFQTKTIFADLMRHRADALYCKKRQVVRFTPETFSLYSSVETDCEPVMKRQLAYPLTTNNLKICFNEYGLAETLASVCVAENGNGGATDSLVISTSRIQMGKRKEDASCHSDNIVTR